MASMLFNTYNRVNKSFSYGKGAWLWDNDGNAYLDASGGLGVNLIGHSHPQWLEAVQNQLNKLVHVANAYQIPQQDSLAHKICNLTNLSKLFLSNSGAEANEAAIKLARLYGHKKKGIANPGIIVMKESFHGRTLATLSASSSRKIQAGYEPLVPGFIRCPYNDFQALQHIADQYDHVVAVLLETVQGYGGIRAADKGYLQKLKALCQDKGWLLMVDEIQCGLGRTGEFLACNRAQIQPDILTLAKGLGGGIPIGATLAQGHLAELFTPGSHGSTFGGNPLACVSALSVLNILEQHQLTQNAQLQGSLIRSTLTEQLQDHPLFKEIRGCGLMIGLEINQDATPVKTKARELGLLIDVTALNVIRLLPPLTLSQEESLALCDKLVRAINSQTSQPKKL